MADTYTIGDIARITGRKVGTIRGWTRDERLPSHLMPTRTRDGHRVWTREQAEGVATFARGLDRRANRPTSAEPVDIDDLMRRDPMAERVARLERTVEVLSALVAEVRVKLARDGVQFRVPADEMDETFAQPPF